MEQEIQLKRAYEPASPEDGFRVYIDRLWPRGMSHATFHYNLWDKEIAPSTALREWFHAAPQEHWAEIERRYLTQLKAAPEFASLLKTIAGKPKVTLLYSSRDREHNNAVVVEKAIAAATGHEEVQTGDGE